MEREMIIRGKMKHESLEKVVVWCWQFLQDRIHTDNSLLGVIQLYNNNAASLVQWHLTI